MTSQLTALISVVCVYHYVRVIIDAYIIYGVIYLCQPCAKYESTILVTLALSKNNNNTYVHSKILRNNQKRARLRSPAHFE